jgi:hypothetical protein
MEGMVLILAAVGNGGLEVMYVGYNSHRFLSMEPEGREGDVALGGHRVQGK